MIVPDVNLLLYAYDASSRYHPASRDWWEKTLNGDERVGLPWHTILGFVRLTTNPRISDFPLSPEAAIQAVRTWLSHPRVEILQPGDRHAEILFGLIAAAGVAGNLTSDAHLAAIAIEHRAELVSTDRDFARFRGLRWSNPIERSVTGPRPIR